MTTHVDVLFYNSIGPVFTAQSVKQGGIGGSELEIVQIAEELKRRGYSVALATGVTNRSTYEDILHIPYNEVVGISARALYLERCSLPIQSPRADQILVRATDTYFDGYDCHRRLLEERGGVLVGVSQWQVDQFGFAKNKHVINPILGATPPTKKVPGRFIYASAPMKGLTSTLDKWRDLKNKYTSKLAKCNLVIVTPGHFDYYADKMPDLSKDYADLDISYYGSPSVESYREYIASAEGLFYVNTMPETFCCAGAFAERSATRTHILCKNGYGGILEAVEHSEFITTRESIFEENFINAIGREPASVEVKSRSPEALGDKWEAVLGLSGNKIISIPKIGHESGLPDESLPKNKEPLSKLFGGADGFLSKLRSAIAVGGSEYALGINLFNLVVTTRASVVCEIGRFKGFSTLAIASGLALCDEGWQEPKMSEQRPDVDYPKYHSTKERKLLSIDPCPTQEAIDLIKDCGLEKYVRFIDEPSNKLDLRGDPIDVLFIDGLHTYEGIKTDYDRYSSLVRNGGYIVFHDMFGWYDHNGVNNSPSKRFVDEISGEKILMDTGYASLTILRKTHGLVEVSPPKVEPREDGNPTLGAVIIARDENPIIARAINSCKGIVDCVTVVVDSLSKDGTKDIAESMGAQVYIRQAPPAGGLAAVRNDALSIAEKRTDYIVILDADDSLGGKRPDDLTLDCYLLTIEDHGTTYDRPQIIKSGKGFRYRGCDRDCVWDVKHEFLQGTPEASTGQNADLKYYRLGGIKGVSGWQDQAGAEAKYLRHAKAFEHHHIDHPECTRTVYYLGQSYRDAGEPAKAREWFRKRMEMGGFEEEAWFAAYMVADMTATLNEDPTVAYETAFNMRPFRAEPAHRLARWYRDDKVRKYESAYLWASRAASIPHPTGELLFIDKAIYEWRSLEELALACHYTRRKDEAMAVGQKLLQICPDKQWVHGFLMLASKGL